MSPSAASHSTRPTDNPDGMPRNEIRLVGTVSAAPQERVLPSGDRLVALRVVVPRTGPKRTPTSPPVDAIDITCWSSATRRTALRLGPGVLVRVEGALRRRFFRTGGGFGGSAGGASAMPLSRYEVEVSSISRVKPPPVG